MVSFNVFLYCYFSYKPEFSSNGLIRSNSTFFLSHCIPIMCGVSTFSDVKLISEFIWQCLSELVIFLSVGNGAFLIFLLPWYSVHVMTLKIKTFFLNWGYLIIMKYSSYRKTGRNFVVLFNHLLSKSRLGVLPPRRPVRLIAFVIIKCICMCVLESMYVHKYVSIYVYLCVYVFIMNWGIFGVFSGYWSNAIITFDI